jgi:hypothetical protein
MLALLYLLPERSFSLSDIARQVGVNVKAVHQEANRLAQAGLVREQRTGNMRLLSAETEGPLSRPLTDLMAVTYGPLPVLTACLADVRGVEHAFIYGSWAARYHDQPGPPPRDIDLLIVGEADPDDIEDAVQPARQQLRREVNVRRLPSASWNDRSPTDPFLASIHERPLVELPLRLP